MKVFSEWHLRSSALESRCARQSRVDLGVLEFDKAELAEQSGAVPISPLPILVF